MEHGQHLRVGGWGGGGGSEKQVVAHIPIVTFRFKLFEWYKSLPSVNFLEWLKRVLQSFIKWTGNSLTVL